MASHPSAHRYLVLEKTTVVRCSGLLRETSSESARNKPTIRRRAQMSAEVPDGCDELPCRCAHSQDGSSTDTRRPVDGKTARKAKAVLKQRAASARPIPGERPLD